MTLNELLSAIGISNSEKIQITRQDSWNHVDELETSSPFLTILGNAEIQELEAVSKGVIRVSIDWDDVVLAKEVTNESEAITND